MSEKLTQVQHVQKRYVLPVRRETGQIVPKRLANHEVVMSDVSHDGTRAYDGCEEQTTVEGIADMRRGTPASDRRGRTDALDEPGLDYFLTNDNSVDDQTSRKCTIIEVECIRVLCVLTRG